MTRTVAVRVSMALAALVAAAGCGGNAERPPTQADGDRPFEVTSRTETFVDRSRPTAEAGDQGPRPERTLRTITYYPIGEGRFPLVVFAHGNTVADPGYYAVLLNSWAGATTTAPTPGSTGRSSRIPAWS